VKGVKCFSTASKASYLFILNWPLPFLFPESFSSSKIISLTAFGSLGQKNYFTSNTLADQGIHSNSIVTISCSPKWATFVFSFSISS